MKTRIEIKLALLGAAMALPGLAAANPLVNINAISSSAEYDPYHHTANVQGASYTYTLPNASVRAQQARPRPETPSTDVAPQTWNSRGVEAR